MSFMSFLRRVGILYPFSAEQITDAETENLVRDHDEAIKRVTTNSENIRESQSRLVESIRSVLSTSETAERKCDPMAQFVRDMRSPHHHHRRN
jgi:hypothetical protein